MTRPRLYTTTGDIPLLDTPENSTLDFKARESSRARGDALAECGKDLAALANHLGGALIIGCADEQDRLSAYCPLSKDQAEATTATYEKAARDFCEPVPLFVPAVIPADETLHGKQGFFVAMNVTANAHAVIGVRSASSPNSWRFPLRQMAGTIFLTPDRVAMYSDPRVRRALVLLHRVPERESVLVREDGAHGPKHGRALLLGIDVDRNAVRFGCDEGQMKQRRFPQNRATFSFPIDCVQTVYFDDSVDLWRVNFEM